MNQLLSCIIIEDEPLAIRRLQSLIDKQKYLFLLGNVEDIEEVDDLAFDFKSTDIVFLDLQIQGGNIEMLKIYLTPVPYIIVTSALYPRDYPNFIRERDYLILRKPFSSIGFESCLQIILDKHCLSKND